MPSQVTETMIEKAVSFHGHWCPGLARGVRVAAWISENLGTASDEEIVTVAEGSMCAVDAIQAIVGCTIGKGSLIIENKGKMAFSVFRRADGRSVRIVERRREGGNFERTSELRSLLAKEGLSLSERSQLERELSDLRERDIERLLSTPFDDLFAIKETTLPMPPVAKILPTVLCEQCGEGAMASCIVNRDGKALCLDCAGRH